MGALSHYFYRSHASSRSKEERQLSASVQHMFSGGLDPSISFLSDHILLLLFLVIFSNHRMHMNIFCVSFLPDSNTHSIVFILFFIATTTTAAFCQIGTMTIDYFSLPPYPLHLSHSNNRATDERGLAVRERELLYYWSLSGIRGIEDRASR
jgi:hypothetical protein